MQNHPRPIALAIIRRPRDGALLLMECHDHPTNQTFYRPLGGGIQFGEHSSQTVRRELHEEADLELGDLRYLGAIENIFTHQGQTGHEIAMLYSARLAPASTWAYEQDPLHAVEDNGQPFLARWLPLTHFTPASAPPLYPTGIQSLIVRLRARLSSAEAAHDQVSNLQSLSPSPCQFAHHPVKFLYNGTPNKESATN